MINIYEVGGSVRDKLLGLESKDKDFVVVFDDVTIGIDKAWNNLIYYLKNQGYEIFLETKDEDKVLSCRKCDINYKPSLALNINCNVCVCGNVWIPSFMDSFINQILS